MARTFDRQTTEIHIRAALLNRFTQSPARLRQALHDADKDQGEPRPQAGFGDGASSAK